MDFVSIEMLEKFLSTKDLITVGVIWFLVKGKVATHFKAIESSLEIIGKNIQQLKDSIMDLEKSQTKKIGDLSERVTKLEEKN
jgi:DNA anti-recombination protein RmuC